MMVIGYLTQSQLLGTTHLCVALPKFTVCTGSCVCSQGVLEFLEQDSTRDKTVKSTRAT